MTTAQGLCDFISAMDTARIPEWNCWYHLMNCGFPLKVSGETDFPCMSGARVGQGRVYVQLGKVERVDFTAWCEGLAKGRSYVSDGYAHALEFTVDGKSAGQSVELAKPGKVAVKAKVAFASETPLGIAHGGEVPREAAPWVGDTVTLHGPRHPDEARRKGGTAPRRTDRQRRRVAGKDVPADDKIHDLSFDVPIERSSWVALRHFPQMHTNPVNVRVAGKPIRASRQSALWCVGCIEQLCVDAAGRSPRRARDGPCDVSASHRDVSQDRGRSGGKELRPTAFWGTDRAHAIQPERLSRLSEPGHTGEQPGCLTHAATG